MSESTIRDARRKGQGARRARGKGARGKGQARSPSLRLFLFLFLFLLLGGSAAMADLNAETAPAITWPEKLYNPAPAVPQGQPADLILPLPCGGAMAFRPVEIPGGDWLDDRPVELGQSDAERGYKEGRRLSHLAGAFTDQAGATRRYYLGKYEITRDQYAALMELELSQTHHAWTPAHDRGELVRGGGTVSPRYRMAAGSCPGGAAQRGSGAGVPASADRGGVGVRRPRRAGRGRRRFPRPSLPHARGRSGPLRLVREFRLRRG